jgi:hypothetical protein
MMGWTGLSTLIGVFDQIEAKKAITGLEKQWQRLRGERLEEP